jgi:hypothetical protein
MCEDVCKKIREAVCKDIAEGKYEWKSEKLSAKAPVLVTGKFQRT